MNNLRVEILTPEKVFFEGDIESLTVETSGGQLGILAHHAPMAIGLQPGVVKLSSAEDVKLAVNGEGFVEVRPDKTVILCQTMEWPEEVEVNRVQRAIEEHERKLRESQSVVEYKMSKATLARAFARLRVTK
ncbi:MAG: ATP synthase F1 subunit epsilon [Bacillota bacterium]